MSIISILFSIHLIQKNNTAQALDSDILNAYQVSYIEESANKTMLSQQNKIYKILVNNNGFLPTRTLSN